MPRDDGKNVAFLSIAAAIRSELRQNPQMTPPTLRRYGTWDEITPPGIRDGRGALRAFEELEAHRDRLYAYTAVFGEPTSAALFGKDSLLTKAMFQSDVDKAALERDIKRAPTFQGALDVFHEQFLEALGTVLPPESTRLTSDSFGMTMVRKYLDDLLRMHQAYTEAFEGDGRYSNPESWIASGANTAVSVAMQTFRMGVTRGVMDLGIDDAFRLRDLALSCELGGELDDVNAAQLSAAERALTKEDRDFPFRWDHNEFAASSLNGSPVLTTRSPVLEMTDPRSEPSDRGRAVKVGDRAVGAVYGNSDGTVDEVWFDRRGCPLVLGAWTVKAINWTINTLASIPGLTEVGIAEAKSLTVGTRSRGAGRCPMG